MQHTITRLRADSMDDDLDVIINHGNHKRTHTKKYSKNPRDMFNVLLFSQLSNPKKINRNGRFSNRKQVLKLNQTNCDHEIKAEGE